MCKKRKHLITAKKVSGFDLSGSERVLPDLSKSDRVWLGTAPHLKYEPRVKPSKRACLWTQTTRRVPQRETPRTHGFALDGKSIFFFVSCETRTQEQPPPMEPKWSTMRRKLKDVVSVQDAIDIILMKTGSMFHFETKNSAKYGRANCEPFDRVMHLDWDSGKSYLYHCYGPFLNTRRTHIQRELGDDNVLIVQFTDHFDPDMPFDQQRWIAARQTISDRISIAFKDGKGDNKKPKAFDKKITVFMGC
nr:probable RNA-dependent RNA polymerase 5 [Tanacetum cinerariifolium]